MFTRNRTQEKKMSSNSKPASPRTIEIEFDQFVRAALTGAKYDDIDPLKYGDWTIDRDVALNQAGEILTRFGREVNVSIQQRVMFADHAAELNVKRADALEALS